MGELAAIQSQALAMGSASAEGIGTPASFSRIVWYVKVTCRVVVGAFTVVKVREVVTAANQTLGKAACHSVAAVTSGLARCPSE